MKNKKKKRFKPFDVGAYELFHNGLYKQKVIPNKKKALQLKRKKVDIRDYQPFLLSYGRIFIGVLFSTKSQISSISSSDTAIQPCVQSLFFKNCAIKLGTLLG